MRWSATRLLPQGELPTPAAKGASRLAFLDGLRGVALILMVLNHTSRWWLDASMGWGRYYLAYASLILPASVFLFLVGFCLPIPVRRTPGAPRPPLRAAMSRYLRRGARIVLAGLLLNLLVFPEEPVWSWGVLQTIGLSIIAVAPAMWVMEHAWARWGLLAIAALLYVAFALAVPALDAWLPGHPLVARLFFFEFPPWPWVSPALIGVVLGWMWLDARERGERSERGYFTAAALLGLLFLAAWVAWEWWLPTTPRFGFTRDFVLNRHWTPRGVTNFLIIGGVGCLVAAAYWLMEVRRWPLRWLVVLGQTALMLYFLHQLIVLTLVNQALGWRFNHWALYAGANVSLLLLLVYLGRAWLAVRPLVRQAAGRLVAWRPRPTS